MARSSAGAHRLRHWRLVRPLLLLALALLVALLGRGCACSAALACTAPDDCVAGTTCSADGVCVDQGVGPGGELLLDHGGERITLVQGDVTRVRPQG